MAVVCTVYSQIFSISSINTKYSRPFIAFPYVYRWLLLEKDSPFTIFWQSYKLVQQSLAFCTMATKICNPTDVYTCTIKGILLFDEFLSRSSALSCRLFSRSFLSFRMIVANIASFLGMLSAIFKNFLGEKIVEKIRKKLAATKFSKTSSTSLPSFPPKTHSGLIV